MIVRTSGTVKWFDGARGCGLIACDDGAEVPVRYCHICGYGFRVLFPGDRVEFEFENTAEGPEAFNVSARS